ncbi:MAG: TonB-dependent receptor plug domain-containing protein [Bacteroidota bacterium]
MKKILNLLLIALPLGVLGQATQENVVINTITAKLNSYAETHSVEKAYLQFDKPYYAVGDTIYFKAYVTLGPQHKLSALSGILYADLIRPNNKIYRSIKLPVISGTATGDFVLPDSLKGGSYRVRAYTQWMRNEGDNTFFEQTMAVGSMEARQIPESGVPKIVRGSLAKTTDVQFLPEGGSLLAGNYSRVAFKAVGSDGLGVDVKGVIVDDTQAEVCSFAASHLGMGSFVLIPQPARIYKANITYPDGSTNSITLPKAINQGYTLAINNANADTIRLRITAGSAAGNEKLSLVAQSGGTVYYAAQKQSDSKIFSAVIPKSKFPTGIVQFTLFSERGEPLNERLVFVNNDDQLKLNVTTPLKRYTPRQKVTINLDAITKSNKAATGSFSVAVVDESAVPVDSQNENSILSNLLLTSDLKGKVEQPNYYFINQNEKTRGEIDLLMLTQGYRHFEWKEILNGAPAKLAYQPEKGMQLTGTVTRKNRPLDKAKVTLFTKDNGGLLLDTLTGANGRFVFKDLVFADSTQFLVQAKIPKGQSAVLLSPDSIPQLPPVTFNPAAGIMGSDTSEVSTAYLANERRFYQEQQKYGINKHVVMLKEVKIKSKKDFVKRSKNLNGAGNADEIVTADDLEKLPGVSMAQKLGSKLFGIVAFDRFERPTDLRARFKNGPMLIVMDGAYIDADQFKDINPDRIQGVEVLAGPNYGTVYGPLGINGVLVITSKIASEYTYERYAPGVVTYHPHGFYKAREFYAPQYDNAKTNQKIIDFRSTIYWKPNVITDKDGKATFSYFNSDNKGAYRMVIEGIDADGNLGRQVYRYTVE